MIIAQIIVLNVPASNRNKPTIRPGRVLRIHLISTTAVTNGEKKKPEKPLHDWKKEILQVIATERVNEYSNLAQLAAIIAGFSTVAAFQLIEIIID